MKKAVLLIAATLFACSDDSEDRFETIVKTKILAVRAEHPDLHPGETTTVQVLIGSPTAISISTLIIPFSQAAADDYAQGRGDFDGAGTTFGFAGGSTTPTAPLDLGVPVLTHVPNTGAVYYTAPVNPGSYTLGVFVREGIPDVSQPDALQREMASSLKAFKKIRVKAAGETLNENPAISGLEVSEHWRFDKQGKKIPLEVAGFTAAPEEGVHLKALLQDEDPARVSVSWWTSAGDFDIYERQGVDFIAPKEAGLVTLVALALDRQGGNTWYLQDMAVGLNQLVPDVAGENRLLVRSGGRMFWLAFAEPDDATALRQHLATGKPAAVSAIAVQDRSVRLGWRLDGATYAGNITDASVTAQQIDIADPATQAKNVRIDALIRD